MSVENISCFPWPGFGRVSRLLRREGGPGARGHDDFADVSAGPIPARSSDRLSGRARAEADLAIVVAGSAENSESEGYDRDTLALPGRPDEPVQRVAAAGPRTVVAVNAGMPVLMPWASQVGAVIYAWLPGQAIGEALADVLLGHAEPGGRLPVTPPAAEADCPVLHSLPRDGRLDNAEGLFIGYRGYDAAGITPMFPFGHGLGYTSWDYESAVGSADGLAPGAGAEVLVRVRVRNIGPRPGREVVQAYLASANAGRPMRVLGAFAGVTAAPGEAAEVTLRVPARLLAVFDEEAGRWSWPQGEFTVQVGRSSRDLRLSLTAPVRLTSHDGATSSTS